MPSIALRIDAPPGPALQLDALSGTPTALLADAHRAVIGLGEPLRNYGGRTHFGGVALTIHAGSLAQWKALEMAHAGQVIVIACGGRRERAEFGLSLCESPPPRALRPL